MLYRPLSSGTCSQRCLRCLDLFYDFASFAINLADVVTDFIICISWYQKKLYTFFWLTIVIFGIAQVAYSVFFCNLYAKEGIPSKIITFLFIFPFAQFVPFIVWIQSYDFRLINSLFRCIGLNVPATYFPREADPLRDYINTKLRIHGGFIIESLVESVPQSIIQMVALVIHADASLLDVLSLTISIISVASRGFMLSYSIHRPTFIFNFACFVTDVFSVFCVVSWLFFVPRAAIHHTVFFLPSLKLGNIWSVVWTYKVAVTAVLLFVVTILGIIVAWEELVKLNREREQATQHGGNVRPRYHRDILNLVCASIFAVILFFPALIVVEAFTLSVFPIVVFGSLDEAQARNAQQYRQLYTFLKSNKSSKDFQRRKLIINRHFARQYLTNHHCREEQNWEVRPEYSYVLGEPNYFRAVKLLQTQFQKKKQALSSNRATRWFSLCEPLVNACNAVVGTLQQYRQDVKAMAKELSRASVVLLYLCVLVILPFLVLSSIYSLLYPIICFSTIPWSDINPLQRGLSILMFAGLGIIIVLYRSVYSFHRSMAGLQFFSIALTNTELKGIQWEYEDFVERRVREQMGVLAIMVASANALATAYRSPSSSAHDQASIIPDQDPRGSAASNTHEEKPPLEHALIPSPNSEAVESGVAVRATTTAKTHTTTSSLDRHILALLPSIRAFAAFSRAEGGSEVLLAAMTRASWYPSLVATVVPQSDQL